MKLNIEGTPEELAAFVTSLSSHKPMDSLMNKLADEIIRCIEEMEGNCQCAADRPTINDPQAYLDEKRAQDGRQSE